MNIYCFQHVAFEGLANIEKWINSKGHKLSYTRFYANDPIPVIDDLDFLVIMGGPMSFDDDIKYPWMAEEREFIRLAVNKKKTALGICLGAQIIADAIDGSARHGKSKEIGWFPVKFHPEKNKAGLDFIPDYLTALHWHGDTFKIPGNAIRLASTVEYPNQAFLYRNNIMGIQFHIEMDEKAVKSIIENVQDELIEAPFVQNEQEILEGLKYTRTNNEILWKILDFLEANTII